MPRRGANIGLTLCFLCDAPNVAVLTRHHQTVGGTFANAFRDRIKHAAQQIINNCCYEMTTEMMTEMTTEMTTRFKPLGKESDAGYHRSMRQWLLVRVVPGAICFVVCMYYALQDWSALQKAYANFARTAAASNTMNTLFVAEATQNIHRINLFADAVSTFAAFCSWIDLRARRSPLLFLA